MRRWIVLVAVAAGAQTGTAQQRFGAAASVSLVEHRVDLGLGSGVQRAFGPVAGVHGTYLVTPWLEVGARARTGHLSAKTAYAEPRDFGEMGLGGGVLATPSLSFAAELQVRSYSGDYGTQRWTSLSLGAEQRLPFVAGALRAVFREAVLPLVSVSGGLPSPNVAVSVGAGLEGTRGLWSWAVLYTLERYDFPERAGARRLEQIGGLTIRLGRRLGRLGLPS